jgi:hypothetical protein
MPAGSRCRVFEFKNSRREGAITISEVCVTMNQDDAAGMMQADSPAKPTFGPSPPAPKSAQYHPNSSGNAQALALLRHAIDTSPA